MMLTAYLACATDEMTDCFFIAVLVKMIAVSKHAMPATQNSDLLRLVIKYPFFFHDLKRPRTDAIAETNQAFTFMHHVIRCYRSSTKTSMSLTSGVIRTSFFLEGFFIERSLFLKYLTYTSCCALHSSEIRKGYLDSDATKA